MSTSDPASLHRLLLVAVPLVGQVSVVVVTDGINFLHNKIPWFPDGTILITNEEDNSWELRDENEEIVKASRLGPPISRCRNPYGYVAVCFNSGTYDRISRTARKLQVILTAWTKHAVEPRHPRPARV